MKSTQEKTSKLISYWLRHNPEDANISVDAFGWAEINDVLKALNQNNIEINTNQLLELNQSFDKIRWEIDLETHKIRATHGHSFSVILNETEEIPPEILYHGTAVTSLSSIIQNGILTMNRQYVHLSETLEMATKVAKRHGKPFIIEIDTEELLKAGFKFYKTSENVWLTKKIPPQYLNFEPWCSTKDENNHYINELKREIGNRILHKLYFHLNDLELVWTTGTCDDTLFRDNKTGKHYMVHLTYTNKAQEIKGYPSFDTYKSFEDWLENGLYKDQQYYYNFE
ncbi:RNA 2'-phosphotransferase [Flavobacterium sp. I3-2]|uniref:RNA 2'-phosphotransferase n=1 Tax=Flavobacterium sp. I3-2 TaxID=2748319 RepID=UPI0015AC4C10|nr:RNA 2'-phosphotransferase [Flavobacterium sp. I3-2]